MQPYRVAPRAGAWIEICLALTLSLVLSSLPVRERGLKFVSLGDRIAGLEVAPRAGAWIEIVHIGRDRSTVF